MVGWLIISIFKYAGATWVILIIFSMYPLINIIEGFNLNKVYVTPMVKHVDKKNIIGYTAMMIAWSVMLLGSIMMVVQVLLKFAANQSVK